MQKYTVIRDRQEKKDFWDFPASKSCEGTIIKTLKTGDYTLQGFEGVFVIERKGCVKEFATNIHQKRFKNELERLKTFQVPVVILEFDFNKIVEWPVGSDFPPHRLPAYLSYPGGVLARFWKIQMEYPHVHFIFAGDQYGRQAASSLFKRIVEKYG